MKIRIIGYAGSGKTTLSKKLEKETNYTSIPLDSFLKHKDKNVRQELLEEKLAEQTDWIVEGVQSQPWCLKSIYDADVIIWLDFPVWLCQYRVFKRSFLGHFKASKKRRKFLRRRARSLFKWNRKFSERIPKLKREIQKYNNNLYIIHSQKDLDRMSIIIDSYKKNH